MVPAIMSTFATFQLRPKNVLVLILVYLPRLLDSGYSLFSFLVKWMFEFEICPVKDRKNNNFDSPA